MSQVLKNIAANLGGQVWSALLQLLIVPFYLHYLGMEAYGLIGFFVSLQAIVGVLDFGLSTSANREVAQKVAGKAPAQETRTIIRTLEVVYVLMALLIALTFLFSSSVITRHWVNVTAIPRSVVSLCIAIFGLTVGCRWPVSLYTGVLRGLERQVLLNGILILTNSLRTIGAVLVLLMVPTLPAFLIWQLAVSLIEVGAMAGAAWKVIPKARGHRAHFDATVLRGIRDFTLGVGCISLCAAVLKQLDKLLISKLMPLEQLGYYQAASVAVAGLQLCSAPICQAVFPRLSSLNSIGDFGGLARVYHKATRLVMVLVAPCAWVMVFFSGDLLLIWTRSPAVAVNAATALSVLALAALLNSAMQVPYILQLAAGKTWIALTNNGVAALLLGPAIVVLVRQFGIAGGAMAWLLFNLVYYSAIPWLTHVIILPGHARSWYCYDTLPFIAAGLVAYGAAYIGRGFWGAGSVTFLTSVVLGLGAYAALVFMVYPPLRQATRGFVVDSRRLDAIRHLID